MKGLFNETKSCKKEQESSKILKMDEEDRGVYSEYTQYKVIPR